MMPPAFLPAFHVLETGCREPLAWEAGVDANVC
jgi:hypothetical protein